MNGDNEEERELGGNQDRQLYTGESTILLESLSGLANTFTASINNLACSMDLA
jgi:hypothetical protein